ncbi:MAG: T9SS type A sorting domain-containing protein [Candidatus Latescibacteria bacterium]|nr:T9SS type A sorting domain-containing protein [Candidatus Latescibacterota bacterium]
MKYFVVLLTLYSIVFAQVKNKESIIRIDIPYHALVYHLQDQFDLTVINAQQTYVDAYADAQMINRLRKAGYNVTVLVDDYTKELPDYPQAIHAYAQVCSTMIAISQQYSFITKLETLGFSYSNRVILAMKVTDNPLIEEPEPEIRLVGAHHGNEKISTEITLSFLKYLVENYAFNTQVANLVNNREIWIIPILNPDGHVSNSRYNGAGYDLNRDYGYMWSGSTPSPWSQPETRHIQKHSNENNITLEYEYHSTASYVNYVWDHHPKDPPDSSYIILISQEYADSTYGSPTTQLQKINGYDWYYVRGSAQDAVFGIWGTFGTTIETQYPTTQARVDSICIANRRALMKMITRAGWGISGLVRDSITQAPLFAMIKFTNPKRWTCYTDKQVGDFHKMVSAGTYTFQVEANGYQSKSFTVNVPDTGAVHIFADLLPDTTASYYVQKIIWVRRDRPDMAYQTITIDALGEPDLSYYSLGPYGTIILEADPPIRNFPGVDFTVVQGSATPEAYTVSVSNDWRGSWFSYGATSGTINFDLATVSMDSAKYIRIVDAGGGSTSDHYAGFDLDAVIYRQSASTVIESEISNWQLPISSLSIYPNPSRSRINIKYQKSNIKNSNEKLKIYNIEGRIVQEFELKANSGNIIWNTRDKYNNLLPAGIYFGLLDTPQGTIKQKIVINR